MAKKVQVGIALRCSHKEFKEVAREEPVMAGKAIDPELGSFTEYLLSGGQDRMTLIEERILREYIGFKLMSEQTTRE